MSKLVWGINSGGMESGGEKMGGSSAGHGGGQAQSAAGSPWVKGLGTAEAAAIGTILTGTKVFLDLPGFYLERGATAAWLIALQGIIGALAAWYLVSKLCRRQPGKSLSEIFRHYLGRWLGSLVNLVILAFFFLNSAVYIQQFTALLAKVSLSHISPRYIFLFFLFCVYAQALPGIVPLGRGSYLALIITVIESVILIITSLAFFSYTRFLPLAGTGWGEVALNGAFGFSSFCEVVGLGYLIPYFSFGGKKLTRAGMKSIILPGVFLILTLACYMTNFSLGETGSSYTPFFELSRVTGIGIRDKQMESLFLIGWSIAAFAQTALHLSITTVMTQQLVPKQGKRYRLVLTAVSFLAAILAYFLLTGKRTVIFSSRDIHFIVGPIVFLLPALTYLVALWRDRKGRGKARAGSAGGENQSAGGKKAEGKGAVGKGRATLAGLLCLTLLLPALAGCEKQKEPNDLYYVIMLGVDKGEQRDYHFTFQLARQDNLAGSGSATLNSGSGGGGSGGGGGSDGGSGGAGGGGGGQQGEKPQLSASIFSVEADDIWSAVQLAEGFTSRTINLGQLQMLLLGEELCEEGVEPITRMLLQHDDVPRKCPLLMSRGPALEFMAENKIALESHVGRQLRSLLESTAKTGYVVRSSLHSFVSEMWEPGKQPALGVVAISKKDDDYGEVPQDPNRTMEYMAGELPKIGGGNVEIMGGAIFKDAKLVDIFDGTDARYLNILKNFSMSAIISLDIDNPKGTRPLVLELVYNDALKIAADSGSKEKIKTVPANRWGEREVTSPMPQMTWKIKLKIDIEKVNLSTTKPNSSVREKEVMEDLIASVMKENFERVLYRLQELGSDCVGLTGTTKNQFATWQDWANADLDKLFREGKIELEVEVRDRSLEDIFWSREDHRLDQYVRHPLEENQGGGKEEEQ